MMSSTTSNPVDMSRCYPISSLQQQQSNLSKATREAFILKAKDLMERCCQKSSRKGSLYTGGLGPHVYLRYQMSKIIPVTSNNREERLKLLHAAKEAAEYSYNLSHSSSSSSVRVSLLEGKQVGAVCLLAAIDYQLGMSNNTTMTKYTPSYVLSLLETYTTNLSPGECEVLYGRAGTIQAILWLRQELHDPTIGHDLVVRLAIAILQEGQKNQKKKGGNNNNNNALLSWEWHEKTYLGAAHGIVGILQTLLSLEVQDWTVIHQRIPTALQMIQATIDALLDPTFCHESGNLKSSVKKHGGGGGPDRLVHWCHGAPGLVLLWIQAAKVFSKNKTTYLDYAQRAAEDVIWPRGLLRKGVGLCHGISGNGIVLNRLAVVVDDIDQKLLWRNRAFQYVTFAMNHLDELEPIPDRPYSVFEGLGGLVCFLLQCAALLSGGSGDEGDDDNEDSGLHSLSLTKGEESLTRFPLYEF